jgi:hypothetical protein
LGTGVGDTGDRRFGDDDAAVNLSASLEGFFSSVEEDRSPYVNESRIPVVEKRRSICGDELLWTGGGTGVGVGAAELAIGFDTAKRPLGGDVRGEVVSGRIFPIDIFLRNPHLPVFSFPSLVRDRDLFGWLCD